MYRIVMACVAALAWVSAVAQEASFLAKAEVESLASGKKWTQTFADGRTVTWDLHKDGTAMTNYVAAVSKRSGTANGTWSVDDQGEFCVVWRGGYPDRCVRVKKADERLRMIDSKSGSSVALAVE